MKIISPLSLFLVWVVPKCLWYRFRSRSFLCQNKVERKLGGYLFRAADCWSSSSGEEIYGGPRYDSDGNDREQTEDWESESGLSLEDSN